MSNQLSFHDLQLQKWAKDVHDQKESGLTVKEWCSQQNLSPNTYNYRVRALKKAAAQYVPSRIVEITPSTSEVSQEHASNSQQGTITISVKDITVTVTTSDLASSLTSVIRAARNA